MIRLALPDGHQQKHVIGLFGKTSLALSGYELGTPRTRPDDKPRGGGRFGYTAPGYARPGGRRQLRPGGNRPRLAAGPPVPFSQEPRGGAPFARHRPGAGGGSGAMRTYAAETMADLKRHLADGMIGRPFFRIASEYVNLADRFALHHHIVNYRVIPTYGATEALIPEDADLIIENTETGTTLAKNRLKIIGELFVSTGCLIGRKGILEGENARRRGGRGGAETDTGSHRARHDGAVKRRAPGRPTVPGRDTRTRVTDRPRGPLRCRRKARLRAH